MLFGLYDWEQDVNAVIQHGKKLEKQYGSQPYIIGLPRFKKANSGLLNGELTIISDEEYINICKIYKHAFPKSMLFINTREKFDLNVKFCNENDLFTIDCGTYPGAFLNPNLIKDGFEQFHTQFYNRKYIINKFEENNINPRFEW